MAKLYLKFEQATLKEVSLTQGTFTIGRLPDNSLQIDNLAVSGHHAKVFWDLDHYSIEDLGSLNGTWVNNQRVGKATLKNGDTIAIGKHFLEFKAENEKSPVAVSAASTGPAAPKLDATVLLDTKKAQEVIAAKAAPSPTAGPLGLSRPPAETPAKERVGLLNVLEGRTDQSQYVLTGRMTMIGKSNMATIRLKGFFAPKSAALISRRDGKYFIAPSEKKIRVKINGEEVTAQQELNEGDILEVAGMKAAFSFQD